MSDVAGVKLKKSSQRCTFLRVRERISQQNHFFLIKCRDNLSVLGTIRRLRTSDGGSGDFVDFPGELDYKSGDYPIPDRFCSFGKDPLKKTLH